MKLLSTHSVTHHLFLVFAALALVLPVTAMTLEARTGTPMTNAAALAKLNANGITVSSSGNCSDRNNPTCTSLQGILSGTIDGVITLKKASGATIVVTGGTEVGHASGQFSHANGFKVDLRKNTVLNGYITSSFTRIANRADGFAQWRAPSGNIYCDEGSHWDITYF